MSVPAAFAGVILIWSTTPLAIQWSSQGGYLAAGLGIYGAMSLVYWGAQYVPSGWIAVLFGLSPLVTSIFSALWLSEQSLGLVRVAGLLLGLVGLAVMGGAPDIQTDLGIAAVLLSTVVHAASAVWVRRLSVELPALAVTGGGLMLAVPLFILTWLLFDGSWPVMLPERARFSIVYLALFGSLLGFFWYYYLLREVEAARVNLITLVTPVTALLLGHWLNGEVIEAGVWFGTALILSGLLVHQWDQFSRRPATG